MILSGMQWMCERRDYGEYLSLLAYYKQHDGGRNVVEPVEFLVKKIAPHAIVEHGTMDLDISCAQSLMTSLWNAGIRPHGLKATDAEVKRLEDHLNDMRKLVFDAKS